MKISAVVAPTFGGPEVLTVMEVEQPEPLRGQVVVDVRASGTNPVDYKLYSGAYGADESKLPMRVGLEASGVVTQVGGELEGPTGPIRVGDEVIVYHASGAYATHVVASPHEVFAKPPAMSFEEASGLMLTGTTAVHALSVVGVGAGETLLVHGAAGGVGLMAVQLAVADGVRVIGTAGEAQHELLRSLGAEPVTYGDGLEERVRSLAPDGVDAAIDLVGTDEAGDVSLALLPDKGRAATIVGSGRAAALGVRALGMGPNADPGTEVREQARLELLRRAEAGSLKVIVARTYPLSEAGEANRELATGHAHGKIVLVP